MVLQVLASAPVPGLGCQGTGGLGGLSGRVAVPGGEPALSLVAAGRGRWRQSPGVQRPGLPKSMCAPTCVIPSVRPIGQSTSCDRPRFRGGGRSPGFLGGGAASEAKGVAFTRVEKGGQACNQPGIPNCFGSHVKTQTWSLSSSEAVTRGRNTLQ